MRVHWLVALVAVLLTGCVATSIVPARDPEYLVVSELQATYLTPQELLRTHRAERDRVSCGPHKEELTRYRTRVAEQIGELARDLFERTGSAQLTPAEQLGFLQSLGPPQRELFLWAASLELAYQHWRKRCTLTLHGKNACLRRPRAASCLFRGAVVQ